MYDNTPRQKTYHINTVRHTMLYHQGEGPEMPAGLRWRYERRQRGRRVIRNEGTITSHTTGLRRLRLTGYALHITGLSICGRVRDTIVLAWWEAIVSLTDGTEFSDSCSVATPRKGRECFLALGRRDFYLHSKSRKLNLMYLLSKYCS